MQVGDRVWIEYYREWSRNEYRIGVVKKITPSGLVDIEVNNSMTRFRKDGYALSAESAYTRPRIDTEMAFEDRQEWVQKANAATLAIRELRKIEDLRRLSSNAEADEVVDHIAAIKALVAAAEAQLAGK